MKTISAVTILGKIALIAMGTIVALTGAILLLNLAAPSLLSGFSH